MSWLDTLEQVRTRNFAKSKPEEREKICREVVNLCSYAAAVVAVVPLPFTDVLLTLPIQTGMVLTVGHIHGRKLSGAQAKDLAVELGTLAGASLLAREGIRFILPVFGALLTVPAAFAANWAIGRVAMEYFKNPNVSRAAMKSLYAEAIREGKARFSRLEFDKFRKQNERAVKKAVKASRSGAKGKKKSAPRRKAAKQTARSLLESDLPRRLALKEQLARKIGKVIHLELSGKDGGNWTVDLTRSPPAVRKGLHGKPAMTARTSAANFVKLGQGELDPAAAMIDGALEFEPLELELAQAFGRLIA